MNVFHPYTSEDQHVRRKHAQPEIFTSKDLVKKVLHMFVGKGLSRLDDLM